MSSPDTNAEEIIEESIEPQEDPIIDEKREAFVASIKKDLGSGFIDSHIDPEIDVWIRVTQEAWMETAKILFEKHGMNFFNFLSAIDWKPSPFGREMDAAIDNVDDEVAVETEMEWGVAGGEKRFQLLARVHNPVANMQNQGHLKWF